MTEAEHTAARLVYLPLTTEITAESVGEAGEVQSVGLATDRLFLQILVVVAVVGGVELLAGRTDENASAESG